MLLEEAEMISFGSNLLKFTMFNRPPPATTQNNEIAIPIPTSPMVYGTLVLEENNAAAKIMDKKMRIRYSEVGVCHYYYHYHWRQRCCYQK